MCPPITADMFVSKWKSGTLKIVEEGAHSANTGKMRTALEKVINNMINKLI